MRTSPDVGEMVTNADTTNVVGSSTGLKVDYQIRTVGGDPLNKWIWVIKPNIEGVGMQRGDTFTIDGLDGVEIRYDAPQFRLRDISDEIFLTQTACDPATIGCDRLPIASDVNRGIVQLATSLDPTTPGYYSDAVTPALLQRILDSFRQDELDIGDTTQVTRHYAESGVSMSSRNPHVWLKLLSDDWRWWWWRQLTVTSWLLTTLVTLSGVLVKVVTVLVGVSLKNLAYRWRSYLVLLVPTITIGTGGTDVSTPCYVDQGGPTWGESIAPTPVNIESFEVNYTIFQTNGTIGQILISLVMVKATILVVRSFVLRWTDHENY